MLKDCDITDIKDGKIEIIVSAKVDQDSFDAANMEIRALQKLYWIPWCITAVTFISGVVVGAFIVAFLT